MQRITMTVLAAAVFGTSLSSSALAADPARPFTWTGFYAGANAGWGRVDADSDVLITGTPIGHHNAALSGGFGGVQAGFNLQNANVVYGVEADIQAGGMKGNTTSNLTCPAAVCGAATPVTIATEDKIPWFATFRARAGLASGPWLFYLTGGGIYGEAKSNAIVTVGGVAGTGSGSDQRLGWTVGAGVEASPHGNWSWKLEYLYADFGTITSLVAGTGTRGDTAAHLVRIGLNYRMGSTH